MFADIPDVSSNGKLCDLGTKCKFFNLTRYIFISDKGGFRFCSAFDLRGGHQSDPLQSFDDKGRVTGIWWKGFESFSFEYEGELISVVKHYCPYDSPENEYVKLKYENGKIKSIESSSGSYIVILKPYTSEIAELKGPFSRFW